MISYIRVALVVLCVIICIGAASAVPAITGIADITSNSLNVSANGVTGTTAWAIYGQDSGKQTWISSNTTAAAGAVKICIWGAPLLGGTGYYVKVCDSTGCSAESTFTTAQITPMPDTTFGAGFSNLTASHYNILYLTPAILRGYLNIMPATVFFGLFFGIIVVGLWRRNRNVRLVSVVMVILSPLIMYTNAGLYLGIPLVMQAMGQAFLAVGIAGILLSFVKK